MAFERHLDLLNRGIPPSDFDGLFLLLLSFLIFRLLGTQEFDFDQQGLCSLSYNTG